MADKADKEDEILAANFRAQPHWVTELLSFAKARFPANDAASFAMICTKTDTFHASHGDSGVPRKCPTECHVRNHTSNREGRRKRECPPLGGPEKCGPRLHQ